jgi:ABC-2 type transport system permease protein
MRQILAFMRASWLTASSYRVSMVLSLIAVTGTVIPVFFVAKALQPVMSSVIQGEGHQYFAFVLVGSITFLFIPLAVSSLPRTITSSITSGTMEAVLGTPTSMPIMLIGMMGYNFAWTALRASLMLMAGAVLGASIGWAQLPAAMILILLIILAYVPIGLMAAAAYLAFRTSGPLIHGALILSSLLGGVYYPTHVVPSWLEHVSGAIPLTYGLRALRQVLLEGASLMSVRTDVGILLLMTVLLFAAGGWLFSAAMRYARRTGSLSYY